MHLSNTRCLGGTFITPPFYSSIMTNFEKAWPNGKALLSGCFSWSMAKTVGSSPIAIEFFEVEEEKGSFCMRLNT